MTGKLIYTICVTSYQQFGGVLLQAARFPVTLTELHPLVRQIIIECDHNVDRNKTK